MTSFICQTRLCPHSGKLSKSSKTFVTTFLISYLYFTSDEGHLLRQYISHLSSVCSIRYYRIATIQYIWVLAQILMFLRMWDWRDDYNKKRVVNKYNPIEYWCRWLNVEEGVNMYKGGYRLKRDKQVYCCFSNFNIINKDRWLWCTITTITLYRLVQFINQLDILTRID